MLHTRSRDKSICTENSYSRVCVYMRKKCKFNRFTMKYFPTSSFAAVKIDLIDAILFPLSLFMYVMMTHPQ